MSDRVREAAEFAQAHAADGFTDADLAEALGCTVGTARRVRRALRRQLEDSPSQLIDLALATDRRERPGSPPGLAAPPAGRERPRPSRRPPVPAGGPVVRLIKNGRRGSLVPQRQRARRGPCLPEGWRSSDWSRCRGSGLRALSRHWDPALSRRCRCMTRPVVARTGTPRLSVVSGDILLEGGKTWRDPRAH